MSDEPRTCADCGVPETDEHSLIWLRNPLDPDRSLHVCQSCAVKQWDCPIRFVFHVGIPKAVRARFESIDMLHRLQRWFRDSGDFAVHVFHRREAESLDWQHTWDRYRGAKPAEPYSFRGFCSGEHIVLLWDETETIDSLEWILYHELGHHACNRQVRMFDEAMVKENVNEGRDRYEWKDDVGHEADSEERLVNRIATAYMGGKEYARPWWRPRVNAKLAGEQLLPDPHDPNRCPDCGTPADAYHAESCPRRAAAPNGTPRE